MDGNLKAGKLVYGVLCNIKGIYVPIIVEQRRRAHPSIQS